MVNLNDIIQASHDGQGVQNLANQFGMSQAQAQAAIESVLPALSHGLQAKTQDPRGMAQLFTGMANGRGVAAFSDPNAASAPETQQFGNDMLGQIFGTSKATQQVAALAADNAGVAPGTIQQMLPEIMAMVLGGLFKSASNNGLGGVLGQLGGMLGQPAPQGGGSLGGGTSGGNPGGSLGDILGQVLQGGVAQHGGAGSQGGGSLADVLSGMFGGSPRPGQASSPGTPASGLDPATIQAGIDMLGKMLGHGTQQSPQQQSGLNEVLGQIFGGNKPR